jgi:recombinational DNA repair ATPase RecF
LVLRDKEIFSDCFKTGSIWISKKQSGVKPILLFDDIFDKLDESRVAK